MIIYEYPRIIAIHSVLRILHHGNKKLHENSQENAPQKRILRALG